MVGEPTEVVGLDQKFEDQKLEDVSGTVRRGRWCGGTEDGQVDDGTAETKVNFRLPRGSDAEGYTNSPGGGHT